ncbi:Inner membrane protein import complex subunit Tim54 [Rhizoctonia solani]|uniref:Mitochondrial import inner membrane translocase subunit TIM54 n=1 Tax=Rhizoctonia solani TaxID=456999 RepID=A0A8H7IK56_9AGAM|nr:Inner membrane protein import complex subunit Tim54 [Rhizoctonia solani]
MSAPEAPKLPLEGLPKPSGAAAVLRYTGIPPSWFQKRPKLPSRNWLIFWGVLGSVTSLYIYDRRTANKIKQEYADKVRWRSEEKLNPLELPRRVRVYACRWPGDDDHDRSMKYFRKYVKPILVAAAVDFELVNGNRHGDHPLRGDDQASIVPIPSATTPQKQQEREIQGGILIVGRHTLKEYFHGLRLGWTEGLRDIDREELLARQLASDGVFDEPEDLNNETLSDGKDSAMPHTGVSSSISGPKSPLFSHVISQPAKSSSKTSGPQRITQSNETPAIPQEIPPQPPLLLLSFQNLIGFRYIPHMIIDFFNERRRAKEGAEAAYTLIEGHTRDFIPPEHRADLDSLYSRSDAAEPEALSVSLPKLGPQGGDIDFDIDLERYIPKTGCRKIAGAREREPTKEEREHPPPTEVELTTERFKKELKWKEELDGWKLLRAGSGVDWDHRFVNKLHVYQPPTETSA